MFRFVIEKALRGAAILVCTMLIIFLLMHAIPGNPWSNYSTNRRVVLVLGAHQGPEQELTRRFGLDQPLWRQFVHYMAGSSDDNGVFICGAVCGNLGPSITHIGFTVQDVIFGAPAGGTFWQSRFGYSLRLVLFALLFALGLGISLGILSSVHPESWISRTISVCLAALISIPNFVLGLLAMIFLATGLHWIKVIPDWNDPAAWIVPAVILSAMPMASIARVTRTAMMSVKHEDYVRTARGKGLSERQVQLVHVMRNAAVPIATFLGPTVMEMFAGLFIVENLYAFPGIGSEYWKSILNLDYPMILGLTLIYALGTVFLNIFNEVTCERLDPRIRDMKQKEAAE